VHLHLHLHLRNAPNSQMHIQALYLLLGVPGAEACVE
jgi:hypothetical protein